MMLVIYDSVYYICGNIFREYKTNQWQLKTSAFANDTAIYIGSNSSLAHLEAQLMHFEKATDIKYNKRKCMGIWLGYNNGNPRKPLGFK